MDTHLPFSVMVYRVKWSCNSIRYLILVGDDLDIPCCYNLKRVKRSWCTFLRRGGQKRKAEFLFAKMETFIAKAAFLFVTCI